MALIGRKREEAELERLYKSNQSEFVAIYGRRRVGKTFLVHEVFKNRLTFEHAGISPLDKADNSSFLKTQLESFYFSMVRFGLIGYAKPTTWIEAFFQLTQLLSSIDKNQRICIFLDELPWMDTPRSGFVSALENFWNSWCNSHDNVMLIVCGSAASWMLKNLSNNKGGLYGRLTAEIKLYPFTLSECEAYFDSHEIAFSRYDIVQAYMVFGGIPYYLSYIQKGLSFEANTDTILFCERPKLANEFKRLFSAAFNNSEQCQRIVRFLATRNYGYTREEIAQSLDIAFGGGLSATLASLVDSDFVLRYAPYGKGEKEHYRLIDPFCLFWCKFVEKKRNDTSFMVNQASSSLLQHWKGVAFEQVAWNHLLQIRQALQVAGVQCRVSALSIKEKDNQVGSQIDLLIDRNDNVVNLCEMKFTQTEYAVSKEEEMKLLRRVEALRSILPKRKVIHLTLVTTFGLTQGKHSGKIQKVVTLDDLFAA